MSFTSCHAKKAQDRMRGSSHDVDFALARRRGCRQNLQQMNMRLNAPVRRVPQPQSRGKKVLLTKSTHPMSVSVGLTTNIQELQRLSRFQPVWPCFGVFATQHEADREHRAR